MCEPLPIDIYIERTVMKINLRRIAANPKVEISGHLIILVIVGIQSLI
jgi:hypothetical protein